MKAQSPLRMPVRVARWIAGAAVLLALLTFGVPAHAGSTNYTFNAPRRASPLLPLARVLIRLEGINLTTTDVFLNNTQLSVGIISVPNPALPLPASNADNVKVLALPGDVLTLEITTDSLVSGPTPQPCVLNPSFSLGSVPYSLKLTSAAAAPAPTAYRITFYTSMGSDPDGCQRRIRRVPLPLGLWTAAPPNDLGRAPFDTILVIDESGSMLLAAPISGAPGSATRWDVTVEAVTEFVTMLAADSTIPDRLALVFYDDAISKLTSGGLAGSGAVKWFDKAHFMDLLNEVQSVAGKSLAHHPRGGFTSIGGGLSAALPDAQAASNEPTIILMSDGLQNTSPCVVPDGAGVLTLSSGSPCPGPPAPAPGPTIVSSHIPTIGIPVALAPGSAGALDLQALTNQTAHADSPLVLLSDVTWDAVTKAYGNVLINQLKGSTLQMVAQATDTLAATAPSSAPLTAPLDGTIKRVIATLAWFPAAQNASALALQIKQPNSDWVTIPAGATLERDGLERFKAVIVNTSGYPFTSTYAFDLKSPLPTGDWQFRALRLPNHTAAVPYHLRVYAIEKSLDFRLQIVPGRHTTGDPLLLDAEVFLDGKPVTGMGSALSVSATGPNGSIGTLLHDTADPGSADGGVSEPSANPYEKKMNNLLQDPKFLAQAGLASKSQVLSLSETGNGHYRVQLNETRLAGGYKFDFALDMNGPAGPIHRIEEAPTQVEALPDPKTTTIAVTRGDVAGSFNVVITPFDKFGNYVGPGFGGRVKVTLPTGQGQVDTIADPKVDGTYLVALSGVPVGSDPEVSISVNEVSVAKGPLSKLPSKDCNSGGTGCSCNKVGGGVHTCLPAAGLVFAGWAGRRRRRRRAQARR